MAPADPCYQLAGRGALRQLGEHHGRRAREPVCVPSAGWPRRSHRSTRCRGVADRAHPRRRHSVPRYLRYCTGRRALCCTTECRTARTSAQCCHLCSGFSAGAVAVAAQAEARRGTRAAAQQQPGGTLPRQRGAAGEEKQARVSGPRAEGCGWHRSGHCCDSSAPRAAGCCAAGSGQQALCACSGPPDCGRAEGGRGAAA